MDKGGPVQCIGPFPLDNIPPEDDGNIHRSVGMTAEGDVAKP